MHQTDLTHRSQARYVYVVNMTSKWRYSCSFYLAIPVPEGGVSPPAFRWPTSVDVIHTTSF